MSSLPKKSGGDLQSIRQPQKVKVLILSQNKTTIKDFYLIKNFTRLIKLDLSYNKISNFPQGFAFKQFNQLRTLFLHYNKFTAIKSVMPVVECQSLQYFTLFGNQLEEAKARHFFINEMPNLMLMDDKIIRLEERNPNFSLREVQTMKLYFPLIPYKEEESSKIYLEILVKELFVLRRQYLNANPIIKIQRWWRTARKANQKIKAAQKLQEKKVKEEGTVQRQSSLKDYKQDLDRLNTQKMQVSRSNQEIIGSILYQQYQFWTFISKIVHQSKVYLSRQYCQIRGIHYQQLPHLQFIRNSERISPKQLRKKRNLIFFQFIHQQNIIKKCNPSKKGKSVKEISHKMYEFYKINRNRFIQHQERLIKKEADYHHYVLPAISKQEIINIIRKQYRKALSLDYKFCQIPFLIQSLSLRAMAAVSIQRHWKGYKVRKSVNAYLRIKERESAIKIQRWLRNLRFIHRHKFLLEVSHYLKKEKNNEITLDVTQIEAIESYCTYIQNAASNLRILFQENQFQVAKNAQRSTQRIVFHAQRTPYPSYINLTFPTINLANVPPSQLPKKQKRSNVLEILFKEVKDITRITDSKGVRYVKFTYQSIQQALNRKFILALKTYRMINHQFIRSKEAPNVPSQYSSNLISQVNNNRLVTMILDSEKKRPEGTIEHQLANQLTNSKSQSSLNSDITLISDVLCIKIKYFIVKNDLSCTLFIKQPNYALQQRKNQKKGPLQLNANHFYFGKRSLSKRYDDSNGQVLSKISRNIMSLNDFEGTSSQPSQRRMQERRESAAYPKILNTDQSHSIIESLSPKNSLGKFHSYRKVDSYDRFDKEVYPAVTEPIKDSLRYLENNEYLKSKREKIEEIKSSHKHNIAYISEQKTENLSNLRKSIVKENEEAIKKIDEARSMLEKEKIRKHDRIKEHFKSSSGNFQQQFLKKGIKSIKKELKEYEKHRSFRESTQNMPIRPSQPKINSLKTEIREFSMNFSDSDLLQNEQNFDNKSKQPHIRQLLKKTIQNYDSRNQSCQSQKSQEKAELQKQQFQVQNKNHQKDKQRKKLRKKRLVHSVFPQQFYPIRQSNQIGFQLPKIAKK